MINGKSILTTIFAVIASLFILGSFTQTVNAATYDLIAPTGQLSQGQNVQFTINIDTASQSLTNASVGMSYHTEALQYVSTAPGDTFTTVEAVTQDGGKIIFNATNASGFSGTGTFAVVTFKIIATASGSTELCVLFSPSAPTQPPAIPTALPKTGSTTQTNNGAFLGLSLLVLAGGTLLFSNFKPYKHPPAHTHRKTLH